MKRITLILLIGFLLIGGIFAQQETIVDVSDNPAGILPGTLISAATYGLFYDEWDILYRSPSELSNYEGIGVFTAYGNNYATTINPFVPGAFAPSRVLLGFTSDMFGLRAGALTGFSFNQLNNITTNAPGPGFGGLPTITTPLSSIEFSYTETVDAVADFGTADYSYSETGNFTDYTAQNQRSFISGVDLGFIGISFLFDQNQQTRTQGGTYTYTWTPGSVTLGTAPADTVTSYTAVYGPNEDGKPGAITKQTGVTQFGVLADLPLNLIGLSSPVTAEIRLSLTGLTPAYSPRRSETFANTNPTGANAETNSSTLTITRGFAGSFNAGWLTDTQAYVDGTFTNAEMITEATGAVVYADAGNGGTGLEFSLFTKIDPSFALGERVVARTRAGLGLTLDREGRTNEGSYSASLSLANGAAENSTYTRSQTIAQTITNSEFHLTPEVGGVFELTNSTNRLTLMGGMFYRPEFIFGTYTYGNSVTTTNRSWTDTTNTDPLATVATIDPTDIEPGNTQGASTVVSTTVYADAGKDNRSIHRFVIPVGIQLDLIPEKLQLFGGYELNHSITHRVNEIPGATTTDVTTIRDLTAQVSPEPVANVGSETESRTHRKTTRTPWAGELNFMVRWEAMENLTVDLGGTSVMTAIDQQFLFFNPADFISTLDMSVTFRF